MRRTLFGVSKPDLDFYKGKSLNEVIDVLIPGTPPLPKPPLRTYYGNTDPSKDLMEKYDDKGTIVTVVPFGETWVDKALQTNF